ncbi:MAG: YfhO family protein, partial [Candidatus Omnitrophota bacterium]|nr:YfhO family protein [Candidatus Omnitrophota bacterium]
SWLLVYYMGIVTVVFSLISLRFEAGKRRRVIFYILALGLALSFGRYTPLYYIFYKILPGFKFSRYPIKFFFMAAFSLAVLAGMGMDYYAGRVKRDAAFQKFLKRMLAIGFALSFVYLILSLYFAPVCGYLKHAILNTGSGFADKADRIEQLAGSGLHNIKRGIGIFMFLSVVMFLGIKKRVSVAAVLVIVLLVAMADIFTANKNVYQNLEKQEFLKPGSAIEFLREDKDLFRIFASPMTLRQNMFVPEKDYFKGMEALRERVVSNSGVSFGIYDAYGYGSLYNRRHEEIMDIIVRSKSPDETNLLKLLNVKYVLSPKDLRVSGYSMVKKAEKVNIYKVGDFLPRAFLADHATVIKDKLKILEKIKSKSFEPLKEVVMEEVLDSSAKADSLEQYSSSERAKHAPYEIEDFRMGRVSREESVNILKYEPSYIEIEVQIDAPKFLVLSDTYYPGWKVRVDGKIGKIYRADYILRAVFLERGRHIVRFTYDPFSFKIGSVLTLATLFVIILYWLFRKKNGLVNNGSQNNNSNACVRC